MSVVTLVDPAGSSLVAKGVSNRGNPVNYSWVAERVTADFDPGRLAVVYAAIASFSDAQFEKALAATPGGALLWLPDPSPPVDPATGEPVAGPVKTPKVVPLQTPVGFERVR